MSFNMAELDRFPGHRKEDRGARRRGGILRSTPGVQNVYGRKQVRDRVQMLFIMYNQFETNNYILANY